MIDMKKIFSHSEYSRLVSEFDTENCNWAIFKPLHKLISNNRCPICEVVLTENNQGTIDHFRPKGENLYPFLKCDPENYIIMCEECNSLYKESKFPIYNDANRATKISDLKSEQNLLINPARRDAIDFFELVFKTLENGSNVLELKRKEDIQKDSYEYKRCETMIKTFGLGYCDKNKYPNENAKVCRINLLRQHFDTFYPLAKAITEKNKKEIINILTIEKERLKKYGFYNFLIKNQFKIKVIDR